MCVCGIGRVKLSSASHDLLKRKGEKLNSDLGISQVEYLIFSIILYFLKMLNLSNGNIYSNLAFSGHFDSL